VATILNFTSTIHDPEARLKYLIDEVGDQLAELFHSSHVAYTPKTHAQIIESLNEQGFTTIKAEDAIINTYQTALKQALNKHNERMFYCDFDRALHWIKTYPIELQKIAATNPTNDFTLFGRTPRAFMTQPETQTITEGIGNIVASNCLEFESTLDILGTTWMLTPELAMRIIDRQYTNTFGFYIEWPTILWRSASYPLYVECEGLEWETPDRYREEIKAIGYGNWLTNFQTHQECKKRTEMLKEFIESSHKLSHD